VDGIPLITEVLCSKAYWEKEEMLDLLVKHNADINKQDSTGNTPLISAVEECAGAKTIEHFMQYKPDVNILNNKDESPLFIAVVERSGSYARILSENEANPNLIGTDRNSMVLFDRNDHSFCTTGKSLLDIAITQGAYDVVSVLKKYGAKTSEELKR
jgi:ankyrin repeat protein